MLNDIYQILDPVAFSIGGFTVRWYGLAYVCGFLVAGIIFATTARRWKVGLDFEKGLFAILCGIVGLILGARLGYCLFYGNGYYFQHPEKIIAIYEGGMSFHGGLVGGLIGGFVAARILKFSYLRLLDLAFIGVPVGLFFGRCANFVNGELWGAETDLPWGVDFGAAAGSVMRHPSQLYEALFEGLLIFVVLFALSRSHRAPHPEGTYFALFCVLYSVARFCIEFVRVPDSQLGYLLWDWVTMGQILTLPVFALGVGLLIWIGVKNQKGEKQNTKKGETQHER